MPIYGTQAPPMPGQAVLGYGPSGQVYNNENPAYQTPGGVRPGNAAGVGGTAKPTGPYAQPAYQNAPQRPYAWTAAGKALAAREQQVLGGDLYGNQAATGGLGQGGNANGGGGLGGPLGTSPVGIGNPNGGVLAGAQARLHYGQAPGVPTSGAAQNEINRQFGDVYGAQQNTADLDLLRRTAFEGSNLNLDRLKAQSSANVDWQNLMARLLESSMQRQDFGINAMYGLGGG